MTVRDGISVAQVAPPEQALDPPKHEEEQCGDAQGRDEEFDERKQTRVHADESTNR